MIGPREWWKDFRADHLCPRGYHRWVETNHPQTITGLGTFYAACRDCGDVRWDKYTKGESS